ncbi:MAG TPA: histidine utilization repressor [Woeseiaceae bacterium]|nr:histidine utilization repressor [Woeseiaceae bacterium]
MATQPKPRYQQLKEMIIEQISRGELKPRDRVPSENELVSAAGVSRMTANRALRELVDEGIVKRVAGVGTFVADLKAQSHPLEVRNIADEIARRGHRHSARVLKAAEERARDAVADALGVAAGEPVYHLRIVHEESSAPIQLEERWMLASFAPDCLEQDFTQVTPGAYLSAIAPLQAAEHVLRAAMPDEFVRTSLCMPENEPCLLVIRRTWAHGRTVSYARLWHPGSRFELTGTYAPPGMAPPEPGGPLQ